MKIAILVSGLPPKRLAGTEIATYNIAKYLAKRGHEVHVITTLDEGLPKESIEEGFYVHRIKLHKVKFIGIILFWIKSVYKLKKINPDISHVQGISNGLPAFLVKKILNKHYIIWARGSDIYLSWQFKTIILKLVLKNADAVIALTEDMKKAIQKVYNENVFVIPNGVDLRNFENISQKNCRSKLAIKENKKIILFVGTLRPVKGVRYLVEAMEIIIQKNTNTRLMLVGDGEDRRKLEKLVKEFVLDEYVTFVGKVSNEKVPEYMVASDVFVLPSLSEGFPNVVLEAMASGLPIVATKVGGLPEIVKDRENGFLVEPKNPEEIAEKVLLILKGDELRERISEYNKKKVKEYSWERVSEQIEEVYFKALNFHR